MNIKTSSALIMAITLSVSSLSVSAAQHKSDHYMMGNGNAHQGHNMSGNMHMSDMKVNHNEMVQEGGHLKKEGTDYVMHGGNGDQGHWVDRKSELPRETNYKMEQGDL